MRCVVAGQEPLQVVKMKLTSSTLPLRWSERRVVPDCVVSVNDGAGWITARRDAGASASAKAPQETQKGTKRRPVRSGLRCDACEELCGEQFALMLDLRHMNGPFLIQFNSMS